MNWPRRAVRVRVPATSANLGPGFDALGLALTLYDEVMAEVTGAGLDIEVSGEGAEAAGVGEGHLVVRAMRAAFAAAGRAAARARAALRQRDPAGPRAGLFGGRRGGGPAGRPCPALRPRGRQARVPRPAAAGRPGRPGPGGEAQSGGAGRDSRRRPRRSWPGAARGCAMLALAAGSEGHPDNAAACLAGGLTIAWNPAPGPGRSGWSQCR